MTHTPGNASTPDQDAAQAAEQRRTVLSFLALIACPVLAFVSAVFGLILILTDRTLAGVIFILVPTQLFLFLGIWAYTARKRMFADRGDEKHKDASDPHASLD